jgi:hypothetical protein
VNVTQDAEGAIYVAASMPKTSTASIEDETAKIKKALKPMLDPLGATVEDKNIKVEKEQ